MQSYRSLLPSLLFALTLHDDATDEELAGAKAAHQATLSRLDDALAAARRAHALGVEAAQRTLLVAYDAALERATIREDDSALQTLRHERQQLESKIPRRIDSLGDDTLLECVLGIYGQSIRGVRYPFVNLRPPSEDLWTKEIQEQMRGKVTFEAIDYLGTAKIIIPEDGWYTVDLPENGTQFRLNGMLMNAGDLELRRGVYDLEIYTNTWGQMYIVNARAAVRKKGTQQFLPFLNAKRAVDCFLAQEIEGRRVVEVSGFVPKCFEGRIEGKGPEQRAASGKG